MKKVKIKNKIYHVNEDVVKLTDPENPGVSLYMSKKDYEKEAEVPVFPEKIKFYDSYPIIPCEALKAMAHLSYVIELYDEATGFSGRNHDKAHACIRLYNDNILRVTDTYLNDSGFLRFKNTEAALDFLRKYEDLIIKASIYIFGVKL